MSIGNYENSIEEESGDHTGGNHGGHDAAKSDEQRRWSRGKKEGSRITRIRFSWVISRLLSLVKKCHSGNQNVTGSGRWKREKEPSSESPGPRGVLEEYGGGSPVHEVSGCRMPEHTFNLAAGHRLLSLIAAAKGELDKITDLRRQMEMFLQNVKEEYHSEDRILRPLESEIAHPSNIATVDLSNISTPLIRLDHAPPLSQAESGGTMACDLFSNCNTPVKEECMKEMKYLEWELEAELDRLQLGLDVEESSNIQQQITQKSVTETNGSFSDNSEEVVDLREARNVQDNGVSPYELERRLHQLLQARQEDRIRELEAHLEVVKQKLTEKEIEIAWWKDTARLISQRVPESSRFMR